MIAELDLATLQTRADELVAEVRPLLPARPRAKEAARKLRSTITFGRNLRENRRRFRAGDEAIRPLFYIWTMLNACNFDCTYCDNHRGQKYPDLPNRGALKTEQGKQLLRIMRTGTSALYFCGGEPTLRPDLPELTDEASRLGYWPLMINTNGSRFHRVLSRPEWARWLTQMDVIIVSLDSLDLEVLRDMYVYKTPDDVIANLMALQTLSGPAGFKLVVNCVIQPGRVADARAVLRFTQALGCWFSCVPMNVASQVNGELAVTEEYHELAAEILDRADRGERIVGGPQFLERVLYPTAARACVPLSFVHVDPDGSVLWPCKPTVNVDPRHLPVLGRSSLDEVWEEGRALLDPTGFHGQDPSQCGGDCAWLQHHVADAYAGLVRDPSQAGWVVASLRRFLFKR